MPDRIATRLLGTAIPCDASPPFRNPVKKPLHAMASQNFGGQQWFFIALCERAAPIEGPLNHSRI
jgi:hypothetical protein